MTDADREGRPRDVVVVGGGVAGLTVARDLAQAGVDVTVLEATDRLGGTVAACEIAGLRLDVGAESFATRTRDVADLLGELGLADDIVSPAAPGAWVRLPDDAAPLPREAVLGIPGSPWAADVRRVIGVRGALRAGADRLLPAHVGLGAAGRAEPGSDGRAGPGAGGDGSAGGASLGRLVRVRLGRRVLARLVAPVVLGVHSAHPDEVDLDAVLPGLRHRLLTRGSLGAAVTGLRSSRTGPPGSAVAGLVGGMNRLVSALEQDLLDRGVEIRTGATVRDVEADLDHWRLTLDADAAEHDVKEYRHQAPETLHDRPEPRGELRCRRLVLAVPGAVTEGLLETVATAVGSASSTAAGSAAAGSTRAAAPRAAAPEAQAPGTAEGAITVATLVLDAPELDVAPRGTGVLVADGVPGVRAKALTHATAKWRWLADAAGPGRHVVRLSYGGRGQRPGRTSSGQDVTQAQALADAAALLGTPLRAEQVVGFASTRWPVERSRPDPGHRARVAALEAELLQHHPTVRLTGAWTSGIGLAAVVAHARGTAQRLITDG